MFYALDVLVEQIAKYKEQFVQAVQEVALHCNFLFIDLRIILQLFIKKLLNLLVLVTIFTVGCEIGSGFSTLFWRSSGVY